MAKESTPTAETQKALQMAGMAGAGQLAELLSNLMSQRNGDTKIVGDVTIKRDPNVHQIILPAGMKLDEGAKWLIEQHKAQEEVVAINHVISGFPTDIVIALQRAIANKFGFAHLKGNMGFFGPKPPAMLKIEVSLNEFEIVPLCKVLAPAWEGGWLQPNISGSLQVVITGELKRKFEPMAHEILALTESILKNESIFKGKAIEVDLGYLADVEQGKISFDIEKHRPQFLDLGNVDVDGLILNKNIQDVLDTQIISRLKDPEAMLANNIPLKHGVLLEGDYGTGKTLMAKTLAHIAVMSGWTFVYCKNSNYLSQVMELCKNFGRTLLFCEDVDQALSGERSEEMNQILNILDGAQTKHLPIITICSTNHPENINPAFKRAGRMDSIIRMAYPDAETAIKFLIRFTKVKGPDGEIINLLQADIGPEDLAEVGKACAGMSAAFLVNVVNIAKTRVIGRHGKDIAGLITKDDLLIAANICQEHAKLAKDKPEITKAQVLISAMQVIGSVFNGYGNYDMDHIPLPVSVLPEPKS